jgi:hopanoid biosynthesis associated RND transporter like protein HpnN
MPAKPVDLPSRSLLTELVCSLTNLCARHPWLTILLVTISAAGGIYYTCQSLKFITDRADLIHPSASEQQRWLRYTRRFGASDDVVIVVEGIEPATIEQALDDVGSRLAAHPDQFANVFYKVEPGNLQQKGLQYLPLAVLTNGLDRLDDLRPILHGRWELVSLEGIVTRLHNQMTRLRGDPAAEAPLIHHADLLTASLVSTLRDQNHFSNPWPEILPAPDTQRGQGNPTGYLLNESGTMGFVMASTVHGTGTLEDPTAAIDLARRELDDASRKFPDARFLLTGISVLKHDELRRSMTDASTASVISLIGVAIVLLFGIRGVLHPLLGLVTGAAGMAWSFGYTTLVIGHLNILSVSFAALLTGLGIDFAIHVLSRYLEGRHAGLGVGDALDSTADRIGTGIVTGAVTMSLAFFCATMTDFPGVAELGVIAGGGILLCALAACTILPAVIAVVDRRTGVKALPKPFQGRLLTQATLYHPWLVLVTSVVCLSYLGYRTFDWSGPTPRPLLVYDHNLLNLEGEGLESVETQNHIFDSSQHSLLYALSIADSAQDARRLKQNFEQAGSVRHVEELATRLPDSAPGEMKLLVQAYKSQLADLPAEPLALRPVMPASLGQAFERFQAFLAARPDPLAKRIASSIDTFLEELDRQSLQEQIVFLGAFQYRMAQALLGQFQAIEAASNPDPVTAVDLPAGLRARFVSADGKWLLQIFPRDQIWDSGPLERFVKDVRSVDPEAIGTPLQKYDAARQIRQSYEVCALYASGVILITLLFAFSQTRHLFWTFVPPLAVVVISGGLMLTGQLIFSPGLLLLVLTGMVLVLSAVLDRNASGATLLALIPPVLALGMTCGVLVMSGIPLNPANLIILPLILGIGVNNGVHMLHDFRSKPDEVYSTSPGTSNAIMLTSLTTTMVGLGSTMVSAHRGLDRPGAVLTIGVGACLFGSLVTLPAVLTLISRHRGLLSTRTKTLDNDSPAELVGGPSKNPPDAGPFATIGPQEQRSPVA